MTGTLPRRFWAKVDTDGPVVPGMTNCWVWTGARNRGHGHIQADGKRRGAHVVLFEAVRGLVPEGLELDHLCRNPPCVRPSHLDPVTSRVNTLRGVSPPALNFAKTACSRCGRPLAGDNLKQRPGRPGHRDCRACHTTRNRRYREEARALSLALSEACRP